jgi:predicted transcriptional regulator with HTH domain
VESELSDILRTTHLKALRLYILQLLNDTYPKFEHSDVVCRRLSTERGMNAGINDVVRELHYLAERQLVRLEQIVGGRFLATITADGRDVVEGTGAPGTKVL